MKNGGPPPGSAEKSLGEIVGDVSQKASQLVREEIELAKAEVTMKAKRLGKGAAAFAVAGFFLLLFLIMGLFTFAWGLGPDGAGLSIWLGFLIVTGTLLLIAAVAGLVGLRMLKKGTPPVPELAIEEAKKTRAALEEARR